MARGRVMKVKYDHRDLGFANAYLEGDWSYAAGWRLRVEAPADVDAFRDHLARGRCMTLSLLAGDGDWLSGEACVAFVSESTDALSVVTLSGAGPLRRV